jgi:CubicO group peptidase (beta-lactamase class C family)
MVPLATVQFADLGIISTFGIFLKMRYCVSSLKTNQQMGKHINNSIKNLAAATIAAAITVFAVPAQALENNGPSAAIDKAAAAAVTSGETPGLQVAVFKDGKAVLVKGYGSANLEQAVRVSNDSIFRVGSVTKQFTAAALLLLMEEGKLSTQDKLSKYYPNFPRGNDITLEQMLHHTSGIHSYTDDPSFEKEGAVHRSTDEMVEFIAKLPKTQNFEPGTDWSYSNSAFFILGGVIEKVSGQPLAKVFKTKLFGPAGMNHSALDDETEIVIGRVRGYSGAGPGKFSNAPFISMSIPGAAGSIRSTAGDLVKWNAALYGGKILKPASLAAMLAPGKLNNGETSGTAMSKMMATAGVPPKGHSEYGFALFLSDLDGHRKIDHGGGIYGFSASLSEFPDDHTTVVVLSNAIGKDVGAQKIAKEIERLAIGLPEAK